jgi:cytochrome oxidase assembly protein ShyY1
VRFLLKPGWIAFVLGIVAFAVACYTLLAPWQFRRNAERSVQNDRIAASYTHPPEPLDKLVPAAGTPPSAVEWRQAVVRGRYLPADEVVVRLRTVDGHPAFEVLTAFRADDGRTLAVDRGYLRPQDGQQVTPFPPAPPGEVALTGRIRFDETDPDHRAALTSGGRRQVYAVDSQLLGAAAGLPVQRGYLQLVDGQAGGLEVLPLPDTDSGPFLSYAWQWLTFGAMALFGLVYFIRLELLQRRGPEDHLASNDARDDPDAGGDPGRGAEPTSAGATSAGATSAGATSAGARSAGARTGATTRATTEARTEPPAGPGGAGSGERDRLVQRYGRSRF